MTGAILALEGVKDAYSIIHGPTGCKYYPASYSESSYRYRDGNPTSRNMFAFFDDYFFSQPRLPCTYLDNSRFIMGAGDRLSDLYSKVVDMSPGMIGIVNSPGSSLVGENLTIAKSNIPTVRLDGSGFGKTVGEGFQNCIISMLDELNPPFRKNRKGVNLVGIGMMHLNWEDSLNDLANLLKICGIEIRCTIGAGWSTEDIRNSSGSEFNVLIDPEYGETVCREYEKRFGIPYLGSEIGVPLGFDRLSSWVCTICAELKKDPAPALNLISEGRSGCVKILKLMEANHCLPRGRTFSVESDGALAYAVSDFLYSYMGMIPAAVRCADGGKWYEKLTSEFSDRGISVSDDVFGTYTDIVIGGGGLCASMIDRKMTAHSFNINPPSGKNIHVNPEPVLGLGGTMRLADEVLNAVWNR